jgi:hypothetical protein
MQRRTAMKIYNRATIVYNSDDTSDPFEIECVIVREKGETHEQAIEAYIATIPEDEQDNARKSNTYWDIE